MVRGVEIDPYPKLYVWGIDPLAMQNRILWQEQIADGGSATVHFNWAHAFSMVNRKMLNQVDSKGNTLVYRVAIKQSASAGTQSDITTNISTASNSYVTARAVKAWHRARMKMLQREGITFKQLGKYDRTLKFPLTASDSYQGELSVGSWDHTKFAVESALDEDGATALKAEDLLDDYTLTLTGASVAEASAGGEQQYSTVGINHSWLQARRDPRGTGTSDESSIDHEANPLYNILSGSMASEEVLEIVQDSQNMDPPYPSNTESGTGSFYGLVEQGKLYSSQHQIDAVVIDCPAGLMQAVIDNGTVGDSADVVEWQVELIDVFPMK